MVTQTLNDLKKIDRDFLSTKKKSKQLYESNDGPINDPLHSYTINVHNIIFDCVIQNPNNFCIDKSLKEDSLKGIHLKIVPFMPDLYHGQFCQENCINDQYKEDIEVMSDEEKNEQNYIDNERYSHNAEGTKEKCYVCCFSVIVNYILFGNAYPGLNFAYKLLLTFSITSNRISSMSPDNLASFILISIEKEILTKINLNDIINKVAAYSETLKRKL
ncbi:hypothetical protein AGLY_006794, partial [Aphis glycines]